MYVCLSRAFGRSVASFTSSFSGITKEEKIFEEEEVEYLPFPSSFVQQRESHFQSCYPISIIIISIAIANGVRTEMDSIYYSVSFSAEK